MTEERELFYIRAMYEGLREAMLEDSAVTVIGEDVDRSIIGATKGLIEEFGENRVRNTPISEATFTGACIGAAAVGLKPVVDLMVGSFFYVSMDQVANQAAKLAVHVGRPGQAPDCVLHGHRPLGIRGCPALGEPPPDADECRGPQDRDAVHAGRSKGLMLAAIRDPDPVIYFQDAVLGGVKGPMPEGPYHVPIGVADVKRQGTDVTVVAIGALVAKALAVAEQLADEGISVEVVDPRTLVPLDEETILESVRKTGRLVACDSAKLTCSAASEITSMVAEKAFGSLKAAPLRVAWENVPVPFSPVLEDRVLVSEGDIRDAVMVTMREPVSA